MYCKRLALVLLVLTEFGCQKKAAGPPPRYAVLRFENLSGDPALDWIGRAASEALPVMLRGAMDGTVLPSSALTHFAAVLGGRPAAAPGDSTERTEAFAAGANRSITGYVERIGGKIRIVAIVSNLNSGGTERTVEAEGGSGLDAIDRLAQELAAGRRPGRYLTGNPEALRLYAAGLEAEPATATDDMQQVVRLDPHFGPAWLALTRIDSLEHNREGAEETIRQARSEQVDPLTAANLDLEAATLDGDRNQRLAALRKISLLTPGDAALLQSLAENEATAGDFTAAASDWAKVASTLPGSPTLWNTVAYNRAWAGDFPGAFAAIAEYTRQRPNDPNTLDSGGDIYYLERKFAEAAKLYMQAFGKDPNFIASGDLYKAAWARFSAGDKKGADDAFAQYKSAREKAGDRTFSIREADWLYRTGRTDQAITLLRNTLKDPGAGSLRQNASAELCVWDLMGEDRARAQEDATAGGQPTSLPAVIARFAALPSASVEVWNTRADRLFAAAAAAGPKRLALGYALLLDHKRVEALPLWKQIAAETPATDFFVHAIETRLEGKQLREPLVPDAANINEFSALLDKL